MTYPCDRMRTQEARILGVSFRVETNDPPLIDETIGRFESGVPGTSDAPPLVIRLLRDGNDVTVEFDGRTMTCAVDGTWPQLDDFVQLVIERERPDLHFLHASALLCSGRAALFVGASTSGKTTLALALSELGYPILAEDAVPLCLQTGRAFSFRTRMGLRAHTARLAAERNWQTGYDGGGVAPAPGGVPVGWIFLLTPQNGQRAAIVPTAPGNAVWRRMYALCYGTPPSEQFTRSGAMCMRNETAFACMPALRRCTPATGHMQRIMKHLHPTRQPIGMTMGGTAALLAQALFCELTPGRLQETTTLVHDIMQGMKTIEPIRSGG